MYDAHTKYNIPETETERHRDREDMKFWFRSGSCGLVSADGAVMTSL
jgi:hypothetical protein